ncbi:MAG TPA: hypothetical protein VGL18_16275 [Actinomycetota bacterium]|jgi:hypothetical protein
MRDSTEYMNTEKRNGQRTALLTGLTAAGGTGAAVALARRARRRKRSAAERAQAAARKLPGQAKKLPGQAKKLSDQWSKGISSRMEAPEWRLWGLAAVAMTWFLVRMAEIRQLRRMNRILISSRA